MRSLPGTLAFVLLAAIYACSSPSSSPSGAGGASGQHTVGVGGSAGFGGVMGSGGSAPACNQLADDAPTYSMTFAAGTPPAPSGGTIVDGTYLLSRQTVYAMSSMPATEVGRAKVEISGNTWQSVMAILPYDINPGEHTTSTISVQGNYLTLTRTCPSVGQPERAAYTADDGSLTLFFVDQGITAETVFTRQ